MELSRSYTIPPSHFPPPTNSEEVGLGIGVQSPLITWSDSARPSHALFHRPRMATVAYRA